MTDDKYTYRITLEAFEGSDTSVEPVARFGTKGMKFDADAVEIGQMVFNTILIFEGLGIPADVPYYGTLNEYS